LGYMFESSNSNSCTPKVATWPKPIDNMSF
jgi:hypothetical protein